MGFFDGQIRVFVRKFCDKLDERIGARVEESKKTEDSNTRFMHIVVALALQEIAGALRAIAEIE